MHPLVLLPTYNERENILGILADILCEIPEANILVIDDNSPDGTAQLVDEFMVNDSRVSILRREKKEGLGKAYTDAMRRVRADERYDVIITMDADGSHHPSYLPGLITAAQRSDLVIGSRYVAGGGIENWEKWRYVLSRFGNYYARALTMLPINDLTAGFMAIRRELLMRIPLESISVSGYAFLMDFKFHAITSAGGKVFESPIIFRCRRGGESKISRHIIREGLKTPLRLFMRRIKNM